MHDKTGKDAPHPTRKETYVIRVEGQVDPCWSEWLDEFSISYNANGDTILSGSVVDQAGLHGLLAKMRDLNLVLLSVNAIENPLLNEVDARQKRQP